MDVRTERPIPDREFFKIGEVAQILGVAPSAVRYWQHEFWPHVHPSKTRTAQHVFSQRDVKVLAMIRTLVHEDGCSIREARDRLAALLAEHNGDVSFVEVGQGVLPLLGGPVEESAAEAPHGFLARIEDLEARLADAEDRALRAEAELQRLRTGMRRGLRELREL